MMRYYRVQGGWALWPQAEGPYQVVSYFFLTSPGEVSQEKIRM